MQDEKAFKFLATVPPKWRLFWAFELVGISFALALVAVIYVGDASPLLQENNGVLEQWPIWFIWCLNPTAVTASSLLLSSATTAVCECFSESLPSQEEQTLRATVEIFFRGVVSITNKAKERLRERPFFNFARGLWLAQAVPSYMYYRGEYGDPVAINISPGDGATDRTCKLTITENILVLVVLTAILAAGLAMKAFAMLIRRHQRVPAHPGSRHSSAGAERVRSFDGCSYCDVSSLLIGWGLGYWVTSLLYLLITSWHGGDREWNVPIVVSVIGYIGVACLLLQQVSWWSTQISSERTLDHMSSRLRTS